MSGQRPSPHPYGPPHAYGYGNGNGNVMPPRNVRKEIDVHELLRQEINQQGDEIPYRLHKSGTTASQKNPNQPQRTQQRNPQSQAPDAQQLARSPAPPKKADYGISDSYVYLDSTNKVEGSDPSTGLYIFDILGLNNGFPIENIIEAEVSSFYVPLINTDITFQPEFFAFRRIFLDMETIGGQQYVNSGSIDRKFHFEFEVENAGSAFKLEPETKKFVFTQPVRDLTQLRLRFRVPLGKKVTFNQDVFAVNSVNPAPGPPPADRWVKTQEKHGLVIGSQYAVVFRDFNSSSSLLNETINNLNGHLVQAIDENTVELTSTPNANLIASTPTPAGTIPSATMYVIPHRIAMTIRFRTIKDKLTNFVQPV